MARGVARGASVWVCGGVFGRRRRQCVAPAAAAPELHTPPQRGAASAGRCFAPCRAGAHLLLGGAVADRSLHGLKVLRAGQGRAGQVGGGSTDTGHWLPGSKRGWNDCCTAQASARKPMPQQGFSSHIWLGPSPGRSRSVARIRTRPAQWSPPPPPPWWWAGLRAGGRAGGRGRHARK